MGTLLFPLTTVVFMISNHSFLFAKYSPHPQMPFLLRRICNQLQLRQDDWVSKLLCGVSEPQVKHGANPASKHFRKEFRKRSTVRLPPLRFVRHVWG
jgi:hypothetical protein